MTRKICRRTSSGKKHKEKTKTAYFKNDDKFHKFTIKNIKYLNCGQCTIKNVKSLNWYQFKMIVAKFLNFKNLVVKKFPFRKIPSHFLKKFYLGTVQMQQCTFLNLGFQ